jgi:hypothetical protein
VRSIGRVSSTPPFHFVDALHFSILCNTSGAGKTRLLFEGLCKHWGFYFVGAQDTNGIGAQDLQEMVSRMSDTPGWVDNIFQGERADATAALGNEKIAKKCISKVLFARWKVFETFIEVARELNDGYLPDTLKHDWLLFQIFPVVVVDQGRHPLYSFTMDCLKGATTQMLDDLLDRTGPSKVLPEFANSTFFYVLDEGQVVGKQSMDTLSDADFQHKRPVLHPIIKAFAVPWHPTVKIIVSGTGFSLELFKTVLTSGIGKVPDKWHVVCGTGDFTNRSKQERYITRYLPPSFLGVPSGIALVTRMFEWLRGR